MTISRVNPAGWAQGDILTYTQMNGLDANGASALDKRSGQTDTLASIVALGGAGRIVQRVQNGTDSNSTYLIGNGQIIRAATFTGDRTYTLDPTGAQLGDILEVWQEKSHSNGYKLSIVNGGTGAGTLTTIGGISDPSHASFLYDGFNWKLFDGVVHGLVVEQFLASTTWIAPAGIVAALATGCGGGGGGAKGGDGGTATSRWTVGGGGGGGSLLGCVPFAVTGGASYDLTVGAGGLGGSSAAGASGLDGGDTIIALTGTTVACFRGAMGGRGTTVQTTASNHRCYAPGGASSRLAAFGGNRSYTYIDQTQYFTWIEPPGTGGAGMVQYDPSGSYGSGSLHGLDATGGQNAYYIPFPPTDSGLYKMGGGGGGGAAGPYGNGGNGGIGGSANALSGGTIGGDGHNGYTAAANTGAGGGGGGGGGAGSAAGGSSGNGAAGGSGRLLLIYAK